MLLLSSFHLFYRKYGILKIKTWFAANIIDMVWWEKMSSGVDEAQHVGFLQFPWRAGHTLWFLCPLLLDHQGLRDSKSPPSPSRMCFMTGAHSAWGRNRLLIVRVSHLGHTVQNYRNAIIKDDLEFFGNSKGVRDYDWRQIAQWLWAPTGRAFVDSL